MNDFPTLAKLSCPSQADVVQRERLFSLIDKGRKRPIMWVCSPAGSGKTTLVSSWLDSRKISSFWYQVDEGDGDLGTFFYYMGLAAKKTAPRYKKPLPLLSPEYLLGIPTFTRRYFEVLYSRLKPPFTIVFDNYQDAPFKSGFHEMMAHAFDVIPEGINIIVISREEPPVQLARLGANNKIHQIAWDEVRFTQEESTELMDAHGNGKLAAETQQQFYEKTEGWAAGLVLMMENARDGEFHVRPQLNSQRAVFDYFANEVLGKSDKTVQQVLLRTAFLPKVEPAVAVKLTGIDSAGKILERFSRNHYFTQRYMQSYQYHPLFREFLMARAQNTFSQADITLMQLNAAELLVESGHIEDAVLLFRNAQEWGSLARLILSQAQPLVAQGRMITLKEWIAGIPKNIIEVTPWLLYWQGICFLQFDPASSRRHLEKAFTLFDSQNDDAGALLSFAGAIQAYYFEWNKFEGLDPLLQWFDKFIERNAPFPSPVIESMAVTAMTQAMCWRRRPSPELKTWIERSTQLARKTGDSNLLLQALFNTLMFNINSGDFINSRQVADTVLVNAQSANLPPLAKVMSRGLVAFEQIMNLSTDDPLGLVAENFAVFEESGIHVWDDLLIGIGICGALNIGDIEAAGTFLGRMKQSLSPLRCMDLFQYNLLSSWYCLLQKELNTALVHAEQALQYIVDSGSLHEALYCAHLAKAQILHELGKETQAAAHLEIVSEYPLKSVSTIVEYMYLVVEAQFALDKGEQAAGVVFVRKLMKLGRVQRYFSMLWWWRPDVMSRLCSKALEHGIEVEYVLELIRRRSLVSDVPLESWPYPVKIYTNGKFEIVKDGKPIEFKGKVQKKPIELLKYVVDNGGQATEAEIADALWHQADGDLAHNSFKMALSRLRNLIGKESIKFQAGKVSINPDCCWVEALASRTEIS